MTTRHPIELIVTGIATLLVVLNAASGARGQGAPKLSDFQLEPSKYNSSAEQPAANSFPDRVAKLSRALPPAKLEQLLAEASRPATFGADCSSLAFKDMPPPDQRYCFDADDTASPNSTKFEWMPQGITSTADANKEQRWAGKQAILVSWYDKQNGAQKGVRVSFLDLGTKQYQHVLLVYPFLDENDRPSYEIVSTPQAGDHPGIHAGGIAWYGNYLYVVDTARGIRAFDVRKILDLKAAGDRADLEAKAQIGLQDGKYRSFGYRYVMPQVAAWENPAGLIDLPGDNRCRGSGAPKYSFIAVDRSKNSLVTGEYCASSNPAQHLGRVARWPLNAASGLPELAAGRWRADQAYRLPVNNVQGAISYEQNWYLSRTGGGENGNAALIQASQPAAETGVLSVEKERKAAIGTEDLSFWPGRDEIWTVTEHPGKRVLYGVPR